MIVYDPPGGGACIDSQADKTCFYLTIIIGRDIMSFTMFTLVTNCRFWDHALATYQLLLAALLSYMFINKHKQ